MSERKVLNKYYPPDFDPTKIPKLKLPKNRTFCIRLMAPFNMRCNTCGEYIYKGKKFNSRKETVENENYLGLHIFRFYIKCPRCIAEIAFKTDPVSTDYVLEAGATRNFEALRTAEQLAIKEQKEKEEEEAGDPMKLLENRTKASQNEMNMLETLEDLKEMKQKHDHVHLNDVLEKQKAYQEQLQKLTEEEDEEEIKKIYRNNIKRINDTSDENPAFKVPKASKDESSKFLYSKPQTNSLSNLVRPKTKPSESKGSASKVECSDPQQQNVNPKVSTTSSLSLLAGYSDSSDSDN